MQPPTVKVRLGVGKSNSYMIPQWNFAAKSGSSQRPEDPIRVSSLDILLVPPAVSFCLINYKDPKGFNDSVEHLKLLNKKMVIFSINNYDFSCGESRLHWSLLAYYRNMNAFVHRDNMEGINRWAAEKLYETFKGLLVVLFIILLHQTYHQNVEIRRKNGLAVPAKSTAIPTSDPCFIEGYTPQQMKGYDCGLYVMAVAKVICEWYESDCKEKGDQWFSTIEKKVNASLEFEMRTEILSLVLELSMKPRQGYLS
ncbi:hypothetical protein HHK36_014567 [Tetracentron sinense]|uniref:Ubiquitin-like protease family profile domain-containing protein n=1 Tax=Tetracentron sinense TaxID=13715 RepID=A0A834Z353_TETSI|nr:hypothetical protein HHK36_014567 [Tetracentron sinense]